MPTLFASGKVVAGGVAFVPRIIQKEQKRLPHSLSPGCDYVVDLTTYLFSRSPPPILGPGRPSQSLVKVVLAPGLCLFLDDSFFDRVFRVNFH